MIQHMPRPLRTEKPAGPASDGESMPASSLTPDEEPRGKNTEGGGVVLAPPMLLDSEKVSQKVLPFEFFIACCLKLLDRPEARSPIMSSSGISSAAESRFLRLGEDGVLAAAGGSGPDGGQRGSRSMSLSRTCLTTSASLRVSASAGAPSSARAARIRANVFVLG